MNSLHNYLFNSLFPKNYQIMKEVLISANISEKKKSEFFQSMESLKSLVKSYCKKLEIRVSEDNNIAIRIIFNKKEDLEKNFYNKEFNILKGSVRSLCNNVNIEINGN